MVHPRKNLSPTNHFHYLIHHRHPTEKKKEKQKQKKKVSKVRK